MADPLELLAALVLEDGHRWGEVATDCQVADARAVLDLDGPRLHFQTRPRGGSKTTDEAGVALVVLLDQAPPASRSYAVAVDAEQAGLLHDAMAGFVQRTPGLASALDVKARQVVNRRTGAALEVLPADGASAWGLRPHLVVVDELAAWPSSANHRRLWEAVVSAMPKTGGRLVCLTSAGDPGHWSYRILQQAKDSQRWRVAEMPGPLPWRTEEDLEEQRRLLPGSSFARLHLNRWTAPEDRLTTLDGVLACCQRSESVLIPQAGIDYAVSLDVGLVNDATVMAVGHVERTATEDASVVVVDRLEVRQGRKGAPVDLVAVEGDLAALSGSYHGARVVVDPFQAVTIAQSLRRRGVRVREFTFSAASTGRIGLLLYRLLRDGLLDLPNDEALIDELSNVQLRENAPGQYRLDHERGRHDDRAVAIALLAHELLEGRRHRRRSIVGTSAAGDQPPGRFDVVEDVMGARVVVPSMPRARWLP